MEKKGQSRLSGLDEKSIALYARGMSVRDIQAQLQEMYGVEVSPTLISNVTDEVIDAVKQCALSSPRSIRSNFWTVWSSKFETMAR
jgi:putative transposase